MIILIHVISALSCLLSCSWLVWRPSKAKFYASYTLIGTTLASGTYMVIAAHIPLSQICVSGILYLLVIGAAVTAAAYRFKKIPTAA